MADDIPPRNTEDMNKFKLQKVTSKSDWHAYHDIRRNELFDNSQNYNENHADEFKPENTPMLMFMDGELVATVRLDKADDNNIIIRLVAVRRDLQGKGVGKELMNLIIEYAKVTGICKIFVNARDTALGYYEKFGFTEDAWDPSELVGIAHDSIQMSLEV